MAKKTYSYFFLYAIIGLIATLVGFGSTYIFPMSKGELDIPVGVHIHGACAFSWIFLYLTQTFLIHKLRYALHMTLGWLSILVLFGFVLSLLPAIAFVIERDQAAVGDIAFSSNMSVVTSGLWVFGLGMAGLLYRNKPQVHKRLMFLTTIVILWPAWARWRHYFPGIPNSDFWFGLIVPYTFIIAAWICEKRAYGKIHPVLLVIGTLIIIEGFLSSYYIGSEFCTRFIQSLYELYL